MNIALDYDGTYTADPKMWQMIVMRMKMSGHRVLLITMRTEEELCDICEDLKALIDIWIDDNPNWIYTDSF